MKIDSYIISGGEDLLKPAQIVGFFPDIANVLFEKWKTALVSPNFADAEECYFEMPVSEKYRLFIKIYRHEQSGLRPVYYYVGYLLTKEIYINAANYYKLNQGISKISIDEVLIARKINGSIDVSFTFPCQRTPIWKPFEELSTMRLYGKNKYAEHYQEMCASISINNIDDWFSRLFIAVNPPKLYPEFNLVLSESWLPQIVETPPINPHVPKGNNTPTIKTRGQVGPITEGEHPVNPKKSISEMSIPKNQYQRVILWALVVSSLCIFLCIYTSFRIFKYKRYLVHLIDQNQQLAAANKETEEIKEQNNELVNECSMLNEKLAKEINQNQILSNEIKRLESIIESKDQEIRNYFKNAQSSPLRQQPQSSESLGEESFPHDDVLSPE